MRRDFEVTPPASALFWLPLATIAIAFLVVAYAALVADPKAWWCLLALVVALPCVLLAMLRRRVSLDDGMLTIAAGLHTHRIAITELDLGKARIVDLGERTELRPLLRTRGSRAPGYNAGHYHLRDRSRAFVLLSDHSDVLWLPEKSGNHLLLSLAQPRSLLDALQKTRPA